MLTHMKNVTFVIYDECVICHMCQHEVFFQIPGLPKPRGFVFGLLSFYLSVSLLFLGFQGHMLLIDVLT